MRLLKPLSLFALTATLGVQAQSAPTAPIQISDYRQLVTLSSPQVSPDGNWVAVVHSVPDFKTNKRVAKILVIETATGAVRALTSGKKSVSSPRWSPTGDRIAYISEGAKTTDQVFVIPVKGGSGRQATAATNGVQQFCWSPDGKQIAYVTPDDKPHPSPLKPHDDLFEVHDDGFLIQSAAVPSHIWITGATGGAARRLTQGSWSVLETDAPFSGAASDPSWSPDGKWIAFARQANANNSDSDLSTVAAVNVDTGEVRSPTGPSSYEYQPTFSPASDDIAFLRPHGPTPLSIMDAAMTTLVGGGTNFSVGLDRNVTDFAWMPDGRGLIVKGSEGIRTRLWVLRSGQPTLAIDLGDLSPSETDIGKSGLIAITASSASTPPEIYLLSDPSVKVRRLTDFNASLGRFQYGKVTEFTWTAPDAEKCDGVLTYPVHYVQGRKYPLMVFIHGGPEAASIASYIGFEGDLLRQSFAGQDYFYFEPNYRGSDNLGNAHMHKIYQDPGAGPASDVLSGIAALEQEGLIDAARVSVAGHSYGGYMTAWLIGHDHRWLSATVGNGVFDWMDTYNLSASGNLAWTRDSLGGTPSDPKSADLYRTGSPITYAGQITTPTLILSCAVDEQAPLTQSFALYHRLKDHDVPVTFIMVPGERHTPKSPARYENYLSAIADWIRQHDR